VRTFSERAVNVAQPGRLIPPFGKRCLAAEATCKIPKNVEVVPRLADGFDRLMHRDHEPVARRAAEAVSGIASALVGQPGPPVLIYLLLAGTAARTVRATLLAFFTLTYSVTLACHAVTIGIPAPTWLAAGMLIPFAFLGGLAGRPIGDRLGAKAFAMLAIALLTAAGAYTLGAAAVAFATA
jgi:uncharacterized membrane protein YfcA